MYTLVVVAHIIVSLLLILVILLQIGKSGSLGGIFGGGGGEQLFSTPSGSELLRKVTIVMAVIFLLTSVSLTYVTYAQRHTTVMSKLSSMQPPSQPAPSQPAPSQPAAPAK